MWLLSLNDKTKFFSRSKDKAKVRISRNEVERTHLCTLSTYNCLYLLFFTICLNIISVHWVHSVQRHWVYISFIAWPKLSWCWPFKRFPAMFVKYSEGSTFNTLCKYFKQFCCKKSYGANDHLQYKFLSLNVRDGRNL